MTLGDLQDFLKTNRLILTVDLYPEPTAKIFHRDGSPITDECLTLDGYGRNLEESIVEVIAAYGNEVET